MRIALCGFDLSMTKDALHLVEAAAIVYQKAGEAVSEVVHTYVVEPSLAASRVPRIEKTGKREIKTKFIIICQFINLVFVFPFLIYQLQSSQPLIFVDLKRLILHAQYLHGF